MAFAIDRKAIIKFVTKGGQFPAKGFTPNRAPGSKEILENSVMPGVAKLAQAKAFMAKVKSPKTNINLYFNTSTGHAAIATAIQAFWKELGHHHDPQEHGVRPVPPVPGAPAEL